MEDVLYTLRMVFQFTNTAYGLVLWIILSFVYLAFQLVVCRRITLGKICKTLLYMYPVTYSFILSCLISLVDELNWMLWLGILIAIALPVMEIWVSELIKFTRAFRKRGRTEEVENTSTEKHLDEQMK